MPRFLAPVIVLVAVVLAPLVVFRPIAAQDATPVATPGCPTTMPEENEALVTRFFDAVASGDNATLDEVLDVNQVFHGPAGTPSAEPGSQDTAAWANSRRQNMANMTVIADPIMSKDDQVMAWVTWQGTNPDTGEAIELTGVGRFRIACGKIVESWAVADELAQLMAFGVITDEELATVTAGAATPTP
jgi:ketosteroid isomerase-like protein